MPGDRDPAEHKVEVALAALDRALAESATPWMVIGGMAVIMRGGRRMTTDIDAVVRGDAITPGNLAKLLARHEIVPRIDGAVAFAQANLVLLVRHEPTQVDLDVSFGWTGFEYEALAASVVGRFGSVTVPAARPEDLIIYKSLAGRPKDAEDIATLLLLHPDLDLARVRQRVAELTAIAEAPELLTRLEEIIQSTQPPPKRTRSKPKAGAPTRKTRPKPKR